MKIADFSSENALLTKQTKSSSWNYYEGEYGKCHPIQQSPDTQINEKGMTYSDKLTTGHILLKPSSRWPLSKKAVQESKARTDTRDVYTYSLPKDL